MSIHRTQGAAMLTLSILSLVLIPIALDFAMRGLHTTHELSMKRPD
jgi:hypothetical protein